MWNVCTHPTEPTILVAVEAPIPDGYTAEAVTANPEYLAVVNQPVEVPQVVSRFQARAILHIDGHLTTVEALISGADVLTQLAWQDAQEFRRTSPSILAIASALGWTDAYLDDLFIRASVIEA